MTESTNIVTNRNKELTPSVWRMLKEIAPVMHVSRLFGVSSPEQATAIMLKGYELGLGVTSSFEFIHVIEGKPSLSPRGALALIQSQGLLDGFKITDLRDKDGNYFGAQCYMKRGNTEYTAQFTLEDAKRANLTEGSPTSSGKRGYGNWEKYPERMCTWRAIGFAVDVVCPDITGGLTTYLKMPEAFDTVTVNAEGNFEKIVNAPVAAIPEFVTPPSLNDLLDKHKPEQIMEANGGKIPATIEEVNTVAAKLGA